MQIKEWNGIAVKIVLAFVALVASRTSCSIYESDKTFNYFIDSVLILKIVQ